MYKNTASQSVCFQMISTSDGSSVTTGTPAVYVTGDAGTQASGGGTATHEGNGCWSYAPTQAETNYNHVAFTMTLSGAITQTVQTWPITLADFKATGFSTHDAADVVTAMQAVAADFKADVSGVATAAALTTVEGKIDAIDDYVDTEVAAVKAVTDKLDTAMELDGAVYRFTENALEEAPAGGGVGTDVNVISVAGTAVTSVDDFKADVSGITATVDEDDIHDALDSYEASDPSSPPVILPPSYDDDCRVFAWMGAEGAEAGPPATVPAWLRISELPHSSGGRFWSGRKIAPSYDADTGSLYWDVVRGAVARVFIPSHGIDMTITVPDAATYDLTTA